MSRSIQTCPGRLQEEVAKLANPERWATSSRGTFGEKVTLKAWSNRAALARAVRMQERRGRRPDDWRPLVKLSDGEGY